jgi:hypothetical protein
MDQVISGIIRFSFLPVLAVAGYTALIYRQLTHELKPFAWFVFLSGLIEATSALLWFNGKNNLPLLHIYVAGGFVCLAAFYQKVLDGFIDKKIIYGIVIVFLVFTTVNSAFIQTPLTFNSYALTAESVLIIILSLSTYLLMMNDLVKQKRMALSKSLNWINSALFIYYASSLLIFHFGHVLAALSGYQVKVTWVLHIFFSLVMYCCFFAGLWHRPRN